MDAWQIAIIKAPNDGALLWTYMYVHTLSYYIQTAIRHNYILQISIQGIPSLARPHQ